MKTYAILSVSPEKGMPLSISDLPLTMTIFESVYHIVWATYPESLRHLAEHHIKIGLYGLNSFLIVAEFIPCLEGEKSRLFTVDEVCLYGKRVQA